VLIYKVFCLWVIFVYRVEGEETLNRLLQKNVHSDGGMRVSSLYFDP
jgi:hypothetical protein